MPGSEPFRSIVDGAFGKFGLTPDPVNLYVVDNATIRYAAGEDSTGNTDLFICEEDAEHFLASGIKTPDYEVAFLLNGLLRTQQLTYGHRSPDYLRPDSDQPEQRVINVELYSSANEINSAYTQLGRQVGQNIFKLVRQKDKDEYTAGEWTVGASRGEILIADFNHWDTLMGDLDPLIHPHSWLSTPEQGASRMIEKAGELVDKHGDRIHEPSETRPPAVGYYVDGLENLALYTRPMHKSLVHLVQPQIEPRLAQATVLDMLDLRQESLFYEITQADYVRQFGHQFQALGLMKPADTQTQIETGLRAVSAFYVRHMAQTLITTEMVKPNERYSERQRAAHIDRWGKVIEWSQEAYEQTKDALLV